MRRGGRLFLLLGVVIAVGAALLLLLFLQPTPSPDILENLTPTEPPTRRVVVARIDIPSNTVLTDTETFLTMTDIPEEDFNSSPNRYFTSFAELNNKLTVRPVQATQIIARDDVADAGLSLQIPPAQPNEARPKAMAFQVNNLSGVADQITPGDFVDVIASFNINQVFLRPGVNETGDVIIKEQEINNQSTKTLVQNVQVLKIIKPAAPEEGTPTAGAPPPQPTPEGPPPLDENGQPITNQDAAAGGVITPGSWTLILAVTDQEAEIIKLSLERGVGITLVLRGRGDTTVETTLGATLDLLVSQFGLPLPQPVAPAVVTEDELTPVPTLAPAAPGGTPTTTP